MEDGCGDSARAERGQELRRAFGHGYRGRRADGKAAVLFRVRLRCCRLRARRGQLGEGGTSQPCRGGAVLNEAGAGNGWMEMGRGGGMGVNRVSH